MHTIKVSIVSKRTLKLEILHNIANNLGLLERAFAKIVLVVYLLLKSVNPTLGLGMETVACFSCRDALDTLAEHWDWPLSSFFLFFLVYISCEVVFSPINWV